VTQNGAQRRWAAVQVAMKLPFLEKNFFLNRRQSVLKVFVQGLLFLLRCDTLQFHAHLRHIIPPQASRNPEDLKSFKCY